MNNNDDRERCLLALQRIKIRTACRQGRVDEIQAEVDSMTQDAASDAIETENIRLFMSNHGFTVPADPSGA